ncbi:ABC transporter substrate-binding protein [Sphingomonas solaris]|uniref:ABC transporter substrate-binding protein n=1 Tax=Alterirhizorhabdus solaris TaxID=2529389 RepID=UPI001EEFBAA5|nr:ABC transporter substrate-binding protein [Sphingomonas solaris]
MKVAAFPAPDRRGALRLLGAGALAAGLPLGLGACGFATPPKPVKGGRLRVATPASSTADTIDPARQTVVTDYCRCHMFYDGLTRLDAHSRAEPALAEAIDSSDARIWTVKLRPGVRFHDGKPLTADDVVYSIRRHKDPAIGSKAAAFAGQFADVRAMGSDAVRITLTGPNADLPVILGLPQFQIVRAGTTDFATANGTGAFRCVEFQPGVRSVAARNEDYWRGPVHLGEVELFSIADDSARVNALLSGDVDLINSVNPRISRHIRKAGFGVLETKTGGYTDLVIRLDRAPGNNPDFVAGMKLLMDRPAMRDAVFRGYATIANDQPIPPTNPYFATDLPQRAFDPERAAYHFRKAGMAGATIPLVSSTAAEKSDDLGVVMQQAARRAGITLDLRRAPADGYWTNSWMKVPMGFGNVNPRPTADIIFTQFFSSDGPWNESAWHDARFDRLLLEARGSTDEGVRRAIYGEMQHRIHDGSGVGIPLFLSLLDAHSPKVKGLRPMPSGGLMGYDFASHVWLDEKA